MSISFVWIPFQTEAETSSADVTKTFLKLHAFTVSNMIYLTTRWISSILLCIDPKAASTSGRRVFNYNMCFNARFFVFSVLVTLLYCSHNNGQIQVRHHSQWDESSQN